MQKITILVKSRASASILSWSGADSRNMRQEGKMERIVETIMREGGRVRSPA